MKYVEGLVSVIMPTYKRSEKLLRAIDSVLNQTYKNLELLLVNDNEPFDEYTELLKKRVEKYSNDERFHLILQDKHINGAVARNVGIRQARGQYIAFLDDDDWWELNKLEEQVKELKSLDDSWGAVYPSCPDPRSWETRESLSTPRSCRPRDRRGMLTVSGSFWNIIWSRWH